MSTLVRASAVLAHVASGRARGYAQDERHTDGCCAIGAASVDTLGRPGALEGPARAFHSQDAPGDATLADQVRSGDVVVIVYEGPGLDSEHALRAAQARCDRTAARK